MKKVISALANDDFTLELTFDDCSVRRFDVKPYLEKGIFTELKDLDYYKDFRIVFDTVQWRNGQDFAPETLYFESVEINMDALADV